MRYLWFSLAFALILPLAQAEELATALETAQEVIPEIKKLDLPQIKTTEIPAGDSALLQQIETKQITENKPSQNQQIKIVQPSDLNEIESDLLKTEAQMEALLDQRRALEQEITTSTELIATNLSTENLKQAETMIARKKAIELELKRNSFKITINSNAQYTFWAISLLLLSLCLLPMLSGNRNQNNSNIICRNCN